MVILILVLLSYIKMSRYFDFGIICDIVSFQYTIIYSTFKIIGDNLSFMVSKIKPNSRNENDDVIFFSPIMYAVKIDVHNLETLLNRLLDIITKMLYYYIRVCAFLISWRQYNNEEIN